MSFLFFLRRYPLMGKPAIPNGLIKKVMGACGKGKKKKKKKRRPTLGRSLPPGQGEEKAFCRRGGMDTPAFPVARGNIVLRGRKGSPKLQRKPPSDFYRGSSLSRKKRGAGTGVKRQQSAGNVLGKGTLSNRREKGHSPQQP